MVSRYIILFLFITFLTIVFLFQSLFIWPDVETERDERDTDRIQTKRTLHLLSKVDETEFRNILKPILVERVVGTNSHEHVKEYIANTMRQSNWTVEYDSFKAHTPNKGTLLFTNIIAVLKPNALRHLVFACHYDSKDMKFKFIAATDSAVPCAMLLYLARVLTSTILSMNTNLGVKFVFFDGEEAFVSWTDNDSLYGARHLAARMERTALRSNSDAKNENQLRSIHLLVLLDLLGSENPTFYNYFSETEKWYNLLVRIEKKLFELNKLEFNHGRKHRYFEKQNFYGASISDDHEPFMVKGVPVLHIIPHPFPHVWHTARDNENIIHLPTVNNLLMIFKVFIVEYLGEIKSI